MVVLKYIHQIWYQGPDNIPKKYNNYRKSIQKFNPESTIIIWDENNILQLLTQYYPTYKSWFQSLPLMIQKIDVAKCFILNIWGGVYVDMDIECTKPLAELYDPDKIVVGEIGWNKFEDFVLQRFFKLKRKMINNGIIFSPEQHPFWDYYIPFLRQTISLHPRLLEKIIKELYVMSSTGPAHFTFALSEFDKDITVLPPEYLEPSLLYSDKNNKHDQSYIIHHHEMSWCGNIFTYCVSKLTRSLSITIFIALFLILLLIYLFYYFL